MHRQRFENAATYNALSNKQRERLTNELIDAVQRGGHAPGVIHSILYTRKAMERALIGEREDRARGQRATMILDREILEDVVPKNPDALFSVRERSQEEYTRKLRDFAGETMLEKTEEFRQEMPKIKADPKLLKRSEVRDRMIDLQGWTRMYQEVSQKFEVLRQKFSRDMAYVTYLAAEQELKSPGPHRGKMDSDRMEKFFTHGIQHRVSWFFEDLWNRGDEKDGKAEAASLVPASEVDDRFNHVDVNMTLINAETGYQPLVVGLDFTTQPNADELLKKVGHIHRTRRNNDKIAAEEERLGHSLGDRRLRRTTPRDEVLRQACPNNTGLQRELKHEVEMCDYNTPDEFTDGMHVPGFAYLNYFWDRTNRNRMDVPKGEVEMVPRFVVGCSSQMMELMMARMPVEGRIYEGDGPQARGQDWKNMNELAKKTLRWCAVLECREQAHMAQRMMERFNHDWPGERPEQETIDQARAEIAQAVNYFDRGYQAAVKKFGIREENIWDTQEETDEVSYSNLEQLAYSLAVHDSVCQEILRQSRKVYRQGNWQRAR